MSRAQADKLMRHIRRLVAAENPQVEDQKLLRRFTATGDEQAFEALVLRHGPMVLRVCLGILKNSHAAEDAFQATFILLFRKAGYIRKHQSVSSWLYKVAYHVAIRARAASRERSRREAHVAERGFSATNQDDVTLGELQRVLHEELQRLPERFRASLVLCCLQGKTRDEAALDLGWTLGTLKARLEKGRSLLQARLVRRGIALPAAVGAGLWSNEILAASVPSHLIDSTIRACLSTLPNQVASTGVVSAEVNLLVRGGLRAMMFAKLKWIAVTMATVGLLTTGAAVLARHVLVTEQEKDRSEAKADEQAVKGAKPTEMEKKHPRVDSQGDPLPTGAIARLGTARFRHMHNIISLLYSRDGKKLVSGSWDATVRMWDATTGEELRRFKSDSEGLSSVALSPDGSVVAGGNMHRTLFFWDAATGKELRRFEGLENTVFGLTFAPDGKTLAGVSGNVARVWDVASGKEVRRWVGPKEDLRPFVFSPDLKTIALGSREGAIHRWDLTTEKEVKQFPSDQAGIASLAFSQDGQTLVSCGNVRENLGKGTVRFWNPDTGKEKLRLNRKDVSRVVFSLDGKAVAAARQPATVSVCDLPQGKELFHATVFHDDGGVSALAFSPDGKTLAVGGVGKKAIRFLDANTGKEIKHDNGHKDSIVRVWVMPDGKRGLSAGSDGSVLEWNLRTRQMKRLLDCPKTITAFKVSPDGKNLATTGGDHSIHLWDASTGEELRHFDGHKGNVDAVAFSPDGKTLASGTWVDHTIRLWDVKGGQERLQITLPKPNGHNYGDIPLAFSAEGQTLFSGSGDRANPCLYFWDVKTGKELRCLKGPVSRLVLSPDGQTLATTGWENRIRFVNVANGEIESQIVTKASALAYSPDGRMLACGGVDGVIHLWETATGRERVQVAGHQPGGDERGTFASGIADLTFTPDGKTLISGGGDTTLLLWDVFGLGQSNGPASDKTMESLWADLLEPDGSKAYQAVCALIAGKAESAKFLQSRLHPAQAFDERRLTQLIADLDKDEFAVRERASQELIKLDESAAPAIRKVLSGKLSAEVRRRLEEVVKSLDRPVSGETMRTLRALEALEHIGTSQEILKALSGGPSEAFLTREAKAALKRMSRGNE
jgi:RNA polymerase sigma factor (sigma-70 family)